MNRVFSTPLENTVIRYIPKDLMEIYREWYTIGEKIHVGPELVGMCATKYGSGVMVERLFPSSSQLQNASEICDVLMRIANAGYVVIGITIDDFMYTHDGNLRISLPKLTKTSAFLTKWDSPEFDRVLTVNSRDISLGLMVDWLIESIVRSVRYRDRTEGFVVVFTELMRDRCVLVYDYHLKEWQYGRWARRSV